jgi:small subunit ribosomal protein S6
MTRPPRTYELMTVLAPDVPEDQIGPAVEQIRGYIADAGGDIAEVLQDSPWGRRRLAYPIRHNGHDVRDGYYTVFHFDLEPGRVADVEREILLNDQIIRYLVTVYTAPAPSPEGEAASVGTGAAEAAAGTEQPATEAADTGEETTEQQPAAEPTATEAAGELAENTNQAAETAAAPVTSAAPEDEDAAAPATEADSDETTTEADE